MSVHSRFLAAALLVAAFLTGCPGTDPGSDPTPDAGQNPPSNDGGTDPDAGTPDSGTPDSGTDGGNTDPDPGAVPVP